MSRSTRTIRSEIAAAAIAAGVLALPLPARAQEGVAVFKQGRAMVEAGRWAEACPLFAEAHRLEPRALGILMNMADCYKHVGKTASAWAAYQEMEFLAKKDGDSAREQFAHSGAAALEPTLSRLQINAKDTPGLIIHRDDEQVGKGAWGSPLPVDPGPHKIEATAPGYSVWSTTIVIGAQRDSKTLEIPALIKQEDGGAAGGPSPALRPAAYAIGGVGVAGLIVGGVFGGLAAKAASSLKSSCTNNICTQPADQSSLSSANTKALISTVGLAAGGALAATGIVLFIVSRPSPRDEAPRASARIVPSFGPQGGSLSLVGRF